VSASRRDCRKRCSFFVTPAPLGAFEVTTNIHTLSKIATG
jgi:hypothetical protein